MTQHHVEIQADDKEGWQNWMDCAAAMCEELRNLNDHTVTEILDRYEFRECDYGLGLNIDWPDKGDDAEVAPESV